MKRGGERLGKVGTPRLEKNAFFVESNDYFNPSWKGHQRKLVGARRTCYCRLRHCEEANLIQKKELAKILDEQVDNCGALNSRRTSVNKKEKKRLKGPRATRFGGLLFRCVGGQQNERGRRSGGVQLSIYRKKG